MCKVNDINLIQFSFPIKMGIIEPFYEFQWDFFLVWLNRILMCVCAVVETAK